jgi:ubiquinone/menaquinone biosynthesis C-methylase UbiE
MGRSALVTQPAPAGNCRADGGLPPLRVEEGYRRWAPGYDSMPNPLLALEERCLTPLLPSLQGKNILDLACGTGRWLQILLAKRPNLGVGVDLCSAMLGVAHSKAALRGLVAQADCTALPFRDRCFDLAVFSFALAHVADIAGTISELARVMKPGADLYLSDIHPEAYESGWRTGFRDESGAHQIEEHRRSLELIRKCFHSAGFSSLQIMSCVFGMPERPIFERAGKAHRFESMRQLPALYVGHFRLD